jgi:hypothetical protein
MRICAKPLPAGIRMVVTCKSCGRVLPRAERIGLFLAPACSCGSRKRVHERIPAGPVAHVLAWWRLRRWKNTQRRKP